jgi:protein gp37
MGKNTGIAWANNTFNPWWGCVKISPACDACYAATFDARFAGEKPHWGADAPRRFFGVKHWNEPLKWNRDATESGKRTLVFCASMADVFEHYTPHGIAPPSTDSLDVERAKLWELIRATPALTWMLLTKRPQNIGRMLPDDLKVAHNVWLGATIESPAYLWRADKLIEHGAGVPVRFVSMEPLVEETAIAGYLQDNVMQRTLRAIGISWLITGCESGSGARHTPTDWYRGLMEQCRDFGVPFFLKQAPRTADGITVGLGSWVKLKDNLVEQPYLDGVQHVNFPKVHS